MSPFVAVEYIVLQHWPLNDYFAFWSFSKFIHAYPASSIYDNPMLEHLQNSLHGVVFPYLYHPAMMLLIWPLATLPYGVGLVACLCLGLLGYVVSIGLADRNEAAIVAALVAPSTLWTSLCGQTALFGAALLFGGFRLLPRQPVLAGLLFGLLTYKPQLAFLVPIALVAGRQWRCLFSMGVCAALFMLASVAAYGVAVWGAWLHDLPALARTVSNNMLVLYPLMVTVTSNLLAFGMPAADADMVQLVVALAACASVCWCARSGAGMLCAAAVAIATFLTTPYAFGYDLPLLTGAVIVVATDRYKRSGSFAFWEIMVLLAGFLLPFCTAFFRVSSVLVMALLWLVVRQVRACTTNTQPRPAIPIAMEFA